MKVIEYRDDKNWIQTFCHLLITREGDRNEQIIAAGLIGIDQSTRAIAAHAIKGNRLQIKLSRDSVVHGNLDTDKYNYRFVSKGIGKLNHTILLHKSAVDEQLAPGMTRTILVPEGGNIADIFLHRFATDFNMPHVAEWAETIWNVCRHEDLVTPLKVWTDGNVETWQNVEAFELTNELTEEKAKEIISNLLRCGDIEMPEGLTEYAPALSDVLVPDEEGEVHVIDYLQAYAPHLAASIEEIATPLHDLDKPINPAIAKMKRVPFPSQAHTAQAILMGFMHSRGVLLASDMGTGKSMISLAVTYVLASIAAAKEMALKSKTGFSVLMLVPAITIPKWIESEIKKTIPNAKITVFDNWKKVVKYRNEKVRNGKKDEFEFILLSRDTAKLGTPKTPALIYKERMVVADREGIENPKKTLIFYAKDNNPDTLYYKAGEKDRANSVFEIRDCFVCPDCNSIQVKTTKVAQKAAKEANSSAEAMNELKLSFDDIASGFETVKQFRADGTVKAHRRVVFKKSVTDYHCTNCGHNLMRTVVPEHEKVNNGNLSHRRLQPAWFIEKYMSGRFDLTIIDEIHQYKASSGQGEAMGMIVGASKRVLGLTGTLSDGKASSLYYLLWRLAPGEMLADGIDHKSLGKFIHLYGAVEQKGRYSEDDIHSAGGSTDRKVVMNPPKEIPGLSPKLFVNHLADKTVFLELPDLGLPLVKLEEKPVFVDMDEEHVLAYRVFHNDLETEMKKQYVLGNPNAFAKFIPAVVNAANQPHKSQTVWVGEDSSVSFYAPTDELALSAKERRLLEDIQQEIEEGRRCVVYVRYSGSSEQDTRLSDILSRAGIKARVLKASVSPEDRVDWLEKAVEGR